MFAITLLVTYVMVRLVEYGIQRLTVDPTFPKEWGGGFWKSCHKMEEIMGGSCYKLASRIENQFANGIHKTI